jgi:hypothetical protein
VGDVPPGTPERLVLHRLATFYALSDVVVRAVVVVGWLCSLWSTFINVLWWWLVVLLAVNFY